MAYADKITNLQRFVSWYKDSNIHFEGVIIDGHLLVGRYMGCDLGLATPVISIELRQFDRSMEEGIESHFGDPGLCWAILDKPEDIEPRAELQDKVQ